MMEVDLAAWLNLIVRWLHLTAGVAWIGASFYFVWLDQHLQALPEGHSSPGGVRASGELWAVHGGGFYHNLKYAVAPSDMPRVLHWFKWEAYVTWLSGFSLLVLIYYIGAATYLLDGEKIAMTRAQGVALSIGCLLLGWFVYDVLCRSPIGRHGVLMGLTWYLLLAAAAFGLDQIFADRAAYTHIGAILGTVMAANVFLVIIPNQRKVVADLIAQRQPDAQLGLQAKQRSLHNNYMTLPVLFIMISQHYPMTFAHRQGWLVLALIGALGVAVRHVFNLRHRQIVSIPTLATVLTLSVVTVAFVSWRPASGSSTTRSVSNLRMQDLMHKHCIACHSAHPTHPAFRTAPAGLMLDSLDSVRQQAARIREQVVVTGAMPLGNLTQMTHAERLEVDQWLAHIHPRDSRQ